MKNRALTFKPWANNQAMVDLYDYTPRIFYGRGKDKRDREICRDTLGKWFVLPEDLTVPITFVFSERKLKGSYRIEYTETSGPYGSTRKKLIVNGDRYHGLEDGASQLAINAVKKGYKYVRLEY
jgi:hypothetical protein